MALLSSLSTTSLFLLTALFGLIVGSFLNVVIHRLPIMLERRWRRECADLLTPDQSVHTDGTEGKGTQQPGEDSQTVDKTTAAPVYNLILPRSHCPQCLATVAPQHNIPLLSWLLLGGRCAHCRTAIPWRYPAVELLTAAISVVVVALLGVSTTTVAALLFSWSLIALSGIDWRTTLLPDDITLPLLWLGLLCNTQGLFTDLNSAVIGAALGYLVFWSIYQLFFLLTGREGMGYGDFKLLAVCGAWLGWQQLPLIVLLSSLLGTCVGLALLYTRRQQQGQAIPFGPYLATAAWVSLLWGDDILSYYLQFH